MSSQKFTILLVGWHGFHPHESFNFKIFSFSYTYENNCLFLLLFPHNLLTRLVDNKYDFVAGRLKCDRIVMDCLKIQETNRIDRNK